MMRVGIFCLAVVGVFFFAFRAGRKNPDSPSRSAFKRFLRAAGVLLGAMGIFGAAEKSYFYPRYGGWVGYLTEGWMAGSLMRRTEGDLGKIQSDLSLLFGDTGRFPDTLDVLWRDPMRLSDKRLDRWPPHAEVFVEANNRFKRAHWFRDTNRFKNFSSRTQADDSGGWGYVNDPQSPEWGTVFVNCTHIHFKKQVPWNLASQTVARPIPSEPEPQAQTGAVTPSTH